MQRNITAAKLREIAAEEIFATIESHRDSRQYLDDYYDRPDGDVTDLEISEFLFHNPLLDEETVDFLVYPGPLGFSSIDISTNDTWINEFRDNIADWAANKSWLAGDEPLRIFIPESPPQPTESTIWTPEKEFTPTWIETTPSYILLAEQIVRHGRLLEELDWRDFENLVGDLLEKEGWTVEVTQGTRDGGIDVIATRDDPIVGKVRSLWQAKKYKSTRRVALNEVRELSAVRDEARATIGMMITTSKLTRDAIAWVQRDAYRLGYKDDAAVKEWIEKLLIK